MAFGDFEAICQQAPVPLCSVVGSQPGGIEPICYARNIELANTIIFEGAASFVQIGALLMTATMIFHVRHKFTAVGRREITTFFYIYMVLTFISLILDSGVVPPDTAPYPWFVAVQNGLTSALTVCLLVNGFVGFQMYEDGTFVSVWLCRSISMLMFAVTFLVSLATFKSWAGLGPTKTVGLFVVLYLVSAIEIVVYVAMQAFLVLNTLEDRWPLGDLAFGLFFFIAGQIVLYVFSVDICTSIAHYLDGLFVATVCNLLAVMMVYKYWDSITREDLEFSVGTKQNNWEVKELIPEDERRNTLYHDVDSSTGYHDRRSQYGGGAAY